MLTTKNKILIAGTALLVAYALGFYTSPQSTSKSTESTKETQVDKNVHTQTTTTTEKQPDGTVKTTTTTDVVASTEISKKEDKLAKQETVVAKRSTLNVSALAGVDTTKGLGAQPIFGAQVSKEVLGPITAGVFGMSNGIIGLSIGVNF